MLPALITVRSASTRLPDKCFLPFGEGNVIEHVIRRSRSAGFDVFVCTTKEKSDDLIEKIAYTEGVKCFRGCVKNKLKRWLDCCEQFNISAFHTVDADDPFFDPEQVVKSFKLLGEGYDVVYPSEISNAGAASVGYSISTNVVEKALKNINLDHDTEMIWTFLERVPGLRKIILPNSENDCLARLTLDYQEDYWLLASIVRILGNNASREAIKRLVTENKALVQVNWFLNDLWKENQLKKAAQEFA